MLSFKDMMSSDELNEGKLNAKEAKKELVQAIKGMYGNRFVQADAEEYAEMNLKNFMKAYNDGYKKTQSLVRDEIKKVKAKAEAEIEELESSLEDYNDNFWEANMDNWIGEY